MKKAVQKCGENMDSTYYMKAQIKLANRRKEVRRNIIVIISSILILTLAIVMIASFSSQASDREHQISYKYYKSIQLKAGDTLWSIAKMYVDSEYNINEYIAEVKKINSLKSNQIKQGSYLIVPYYSTEFVYE